MWPLSTSSCNPLQNSLWQLKTCPKKCSFPSPLDPFRLTMTSLTESFNPSKHTPLYKNEHNEREIFQWDCFFKRQCFLCILFHFHHHKFSKFLFQGCNWGTAGQISSQTCKNTSHQRGIRVSTFFFIANKTVLQISKVFDLVEM